MGINSDRKKAFFDQHRACCFCAGSALATTQDHFPSRAIFRDRQWPEGYVFPACNFCQSYSVEDEILVKFMARSNSRALGKDPDGDMIKTFRAVESSFPGLLKSTELTTNDKRAFLRENRVKLGPGRTIASAPIISLEHPRFEEAISRFSNKLFCALYYLHTKKILSREGSIYYTWLPNTVMLSAGADKIFSSMMGATATVKRGTTNLDDQFRYQYAINEGEDRMGFAVIFHDSFVLLGIIQAGLSRLPVSEGFTELKPLIHSLPSSEQRMPA